MKKTWCYPLPVHRFRGILRSLLMTILHCSMLYPHGYCFLNSHPRGRTWLSSPHPTYRNSPPTDNSSQLPRLSLPYGKKPRIHSVSLNAGMVSLNRNIPWIGLRIRCLAHWLRCHWRVPWGNRVYQFKVYIFRRKVSSTQHCVGSSTLIKLACL